jgi:hypothetical protein
MERVNPGPEPEDSQPELPRTKIEPFQVFCMQRKQVLNLQGKEIPHWQFTRDAAELWRGMRQIQKNQYIQMAIEVSKNLDVGHKKRKSPSKKKESEQSPKEPDSGLMSEFIGDLPWLYVVPRGGMGSEISSLSRKLIFPNG